MRMYSEIGVCFVLKTLCVEFSAGNGHLRAVSLNIRCAANRVKHVRSSSSDHAVAIRMNSNVLCDKKKLEPASPQIASVLYEDTK